VKGIEPSLSAWEAEVLPLNYTRRQVSEYQKVTDRSKAVSADEADETPDCHQHPYTHQESHPPRPICGILDAFRRFALPVLPPGEAVSNQQSEAQSDDELGEEVVDSKKFGHG
jgi:hypothetical protein